MKTITLFTALLFLLTTNSLFAQYPIPSSDVAVYPSATFQEQSQDAAQPDQVLAKRALNLRTNVLHDETTESQATVWVYRLDESINLGPYKLIDDDYLMVEIDDYPWGVYIETSTTMDVNVWIDEASFMKHR